MKKIDYEIMLIEKEVHVLNYCGTFSEMINHLIMLCLENRIELSEIRCINIMKREEVEKNEF